MHALVEEFDSKMSRDVRVTRPKLIRETLMCIETKSYKVYTMSLGTCHVDCCSGEFHDQDEGGRSTDAAANRSAVREQLRQRR